jgi:multimeric flavodoxin WrbA
MKTLILNGSKTEESDLNLISSYLADFLREKNHEVSTMILRKEKILDCIGCHNCWTKTPGECTIKDAGSELPKKVIQSDILLLLTPVTFGMYSSELKKAIDRLPCPLMLPFFKRVNGETHNLQRYKKYPTMVAFGVLPSPDEESEYTFATLVARNCLNLHTTAVSAIVYSSDKSEAIREKIRSTLSKVGVN